MSLYDHHSHERDITINMLLEEVLGWYFNSEREAHKHLMTAITHPLLVGSENRYLMHEVLLSDTGPRISSIQMYNSHHRLFPALHGDGGHSEGGMQAECIIEIRHFLRDPRRAGCCYVDNGMYAALSLEVAKVLLEPVRSVWFSSFLDSILLMTLLANIGPVIQLITTLKNNNDNYCNWLLIPYHFIWRMEIIHQNWLNTSLAIPLIEDRFRKITQI